MKDTEKKPNMISYTKTALDGSTYKALASSDSPIAKMIDELGHVPKNWYKPTTEKDDPFAAINAKSRKKMSLAKSEEEKSNKRNVIEKKRVESAGGKLKKDALGKIPMDEKSVTAKVL
jgi:hypothetical protein